MYKFAQNYLWALRSALTEKSSFLLFVLLIIIKDIIYVDTILQRIYVKSYM